MGNKPPKAAKVDEIAPIYVSWSGAELVTGVKKKTLQNIFSRGELPVVICYLGTKPLIKVASLKAWLENLPEQPRVRRGRKRGWKPHRQEGKSVEGAGDE